MSESGTTAGDRCSRTQRRASRTASQNTSLQSSQEDLSSNIVSSSLKPLENSAGVKAEELSSDKTENGNISSPIIECAVCLQTCIHPVKLPCSHIFCYLCVKGVAFQSKRCAMCRQEIPSDFLLHPQLLDRTQLEKESTLEDGYQWFYEGRNGWWQYDDRTAADLEHMYKLGERTIEMVIAGASYVIDFQRLVQFPKHRAGRVRKIQRSDASFPKLGVAGIRWWQYDERTSFELECAYKRSQRICELLIAGFLYLIDFDQMLQYRKTETSRRRRIKRDLASIPKKGVAGLRLEQSEESESEAASLDLLSVAASRAALTSNCLSPSQTPQAPSNTPQTPQTPRSPPSPAPETISNQDSGTQTLSNENRWQERERRRLRRAVEEIERLRLHDGDRLTPHPPLSRLDNMVIYYNMDEESSVLNNDTQDLWSCEDSSSDDDEEELIN